MKSAITPERWKQINDLFLAALEREGAAREQFLVEAAARDAELVAEVRSLLARHDSVGDFMDKPAWAEDPTLVLTLVDGTELGPYRIVREIGRGGMGVVYEAHDMTLGRSVAVKVLPPEYARDPNRRRRLEQEARAAGQLNHESVAIVHAFQELDGMLVLVTELVRGETLRDEIRRGALGVDKLLPTLIQLASGLAAAHEAGIVHRDFKPENVMRCANGRVKILDFGLARQIDPDAATKSRITVASVAMGTPGYMAPEQFSGSSVGPSADVWAFGVVAWELATGKNPFGATTAELLEMAALIMSGKRVTAPHIILPVPGLEPVLRRCMQMKPEERYPSAKELLAALEGLRFAADAPRSDALWWWQFHQVAMSVLIAAMPVLTWFLRRWNLTMGPPMFLAVLALATVSVTIRLNLTFTSRVQIEHLADQRRRTYRPLVIAECLLALLLLVSAAFVAGPQDTIAAVLVTLAIVIVASLGVIEPATTAAALPAGSDETQKTAIGSQIPK